MASYCWIYTFCDVSAVGLAFDTKAAFKEIAGSNLAEDP